MAKGNMLQGMARGKVGDVVFSRLNGEQIARVRNRNPKNPRTNAQLFQRAIMATVMQAYSAGKIILDHAFQGYSVGEGCQRAFMSLNAKYLRGIVASDLANDTTIAAVIGPGVTSPVPTPLIVSDGNYPQNTFNAMGNLPLPGENETFASYYQKCNLVPGDIHTIVAFVGTNANNPIFVVNGVDDVLAKQFTTEFRYIRLQVKPLATPDATVTEETKLSDIFDMTDSKGVKANFDYSEQEIRYIASEDRISPFMSGSIIDTSAGASVGVIRSRVDEDLRSRTILAHVVGSDGEAIYNGIAAKYALQAWKQGSEKIGDSDLILEGGDQ